ncbi:MAG: LytTR family transcriptional regulator DNA-binding domain-containing protein [Wenzhouxiangellaceae bacterium]
MSDIAAKEGAVDGLVEVCPVLTDEASPPTDYDRPDCQALPLHQIDIQDRQVWMRLTLRPPQTDWPYTGLLLSMKAAAEVFVGGRLVARNGLPGADASRELPGQMDAVVPLDAQALAEHDHQIDLKTSSYHNWLTLRHPIHEVRLVDYINQQDRTLRYYLPSLLPMGLFLLAIFYFGSLTWRSEDRTVPALLTALAGLAMLQLILEASRGVVAYTYPVQDLRLIGILACSIGFGLCLVTVLARRFVRHRTGFALGLVVIGMVAAIGLTSSWDLRTALVLLTGGTVSLGLTLIGWRRGKPEAKPYAAALTLFIMANLIYPSQFIDHGFYLLVAIFLLGLMVLQAIAYSQERRGQIEQRLRADQLQRALDQVQGKSRPQNLTVLSTGSMQAIEIKDIVRIQGAGDYAELHLSNGREVLHNATLNELDAELPSYFLRVHRSHLVNTRLIERLDRNESGTGTLYLHSGQSVPVSRRIMPGVRRALR